MASYKDIMHDKCGSIELEIAKLKYMREQELKQYEEDLSYHWEQVLDIQKMMESEELKIIDMTNKFSSLNSKREANITKQQELYYLKID